MSLVAKGPSPRLAPIPVAQVLKTVAGVARDVETRAGDSTELNFWQRSTEDSKLGGRAVGAALDGFGPSVAHGPTRYRIDGIADYLQGLSATGPGGGVDYWKAKDAEMREAVGKGRGYIEQAASEAEGEVGAGPAIEAVAKVAIEGASDRGAGNKVYWMRACSNIRDLARWVGEGVVELAPGATPPVNEQLAKIGDKLQNLPADADGDVMYWAERSGELMVQTRQLANEAIMAARFG